MSVTLQMDMPETAFSAIRKNPSEFVAEMRLAADEIERALRNAD
jgi:hypothetical protein